MLPCFRGATDERHRPSRRLMCHLMVVAAYTAHSPRAAALAALGPADRGRSVLMKPNRSLLVVVPGCRRARALGVMGERAGGGGGAGRGRDRAPHCTYVAVPTEAHPRKGCPPILIGAEVFGSVPNTLN